MNLYEATEQAREALTRAGIRPSNPKIIAVAYKLINDAVYNVPADSWVKHLLAMGRI